MALLTTGDIINFQRTVNSQIDAIVRSRNQDAPASREIHVLDELLDAWRDDEYEAILAALELYKQKVRLGLMPDGLDIEDVTFRAIMALAKRKNLLDTMEEAYL